MGQYSLHLLQSLSNQGYFGLQISKLHLHSYSTYIAIRHKPNLFQSCKRPSRRSRPLGLLLIDCQSVIASISPMTTVFRSACKCRSIVFEFLILFFFLFFFVSATGPLTRYLKTVYSESDQTWQSGRSP